MLAAIDWTNVLVALIAGLPGIIAALAAVSVRNQVKTPSGPTIGQQVEPFVTLKGHTRGVNSLAFAPDGRTLASGSWDGTVRLWEVLTGKERPIQNHPNGACAVAFSPDGRLLASGGSGGMVWLWDTVGRPRGRLKGQGGYFGGMANVAVVRRLPAEKSAPTLVTLSRA